MKKQNKNIIVKTGPQKLAFTLVELIVVITILAILGTIAFISLQGYSKQARDSRRISDITNIKTSLELYSINKGNYPTPDDGQTITYSGETAWTEGFIGDNVTTNLGRNLKKKPLDPLFETEYIYSVTLSQKEYELLSIHEGELSHRYSPYQGDRTSIARLGDSFLGINAYAASSYNPRVDGNYNQIFLKTQSYILASPSIINSELHYVGGILNDTTIDSQIISYGTNIPSIGNSVEQSTGGLDITLSATGLIDANSTSEEKISVITTIQNAYINSSLANYPMYVNILNTSNAETLAEELLLNTPTQTTTNSTVTYSCTGTIPSQNVSTSNTTGLTADTTRQNTTSGDDCYYECSAGYSGEDCDIEVTTWQDEDSNCQIATDVTVTGTDLSGDPITQVWASCNSTLGTGIEYNSSNSCWDYQGNDIGGTTCYGYDTLETSYNATYGVNNIWGKLYIKNNASSACPSGRNLPSQEQWTILLKNLGCTDYVSASTFGWLCDGLGWAGHTSKDETNNIENSLNIPLAGYRKSDGLTFSSRGNDMYFWSIDGYSATTSRGIHLNRDNSTVERNYFGNTTGLSVRCIKD